MKYFKNLSISFGFIISILFVFTFLITVMSYFNIISNSITTVFKMIIPILSLFVGGFITGKKSSKKGWLEGLKLGTIFCIILILFNILGLNNKFEFSNVLFYIILIISSIVGSMIGINGKTNT